MNPLTPDHHFYIDQGTNARVRLVLIAIGRKLVAEGRLDDPEDVMYLKYNELRRLMAGSNCFDAEGARRRPPRRARGRLRGAAARLGRHRDRGERRASRTGRCGPSRRSSTASRPTHEGEIHGLAASAGVVEGTARVVLSPSSSARCSATRSSSAG